MFPLHLLPLLSLVSADSPANPTQQACPKLFTETCDPPKFIENCADSPKPKLREIPGFETGLYFCKNDTMIYEPNAYANIMVEYAMIRCNSETLKWEAIQLYGQQHQYIPISKHGKLACKGNFELSCKHTRLDYDDRILDRSLTGWEEPDFVKDASEYKCIGDDMHLYIKKMFTFGVQSGHYLRSKTIKCETNKVMKAEFAHLRDPQIIDYRDTLACHKFECKDTMDHSLSYLKIIPIVHTCPSGDTNCIEADFFDEQYPCKKGGHELTLAADANPHKINWIKDNFIECADNNRLFFKDVWGEKLEIKNKDRVNCRLPTSCAPLMTGPAARCDQRRDCYDIDGSTIPSHHLAKFNGDCPDNYVLKVLPEREGQFLVELELVECRYGEWIAHLLPGSRSNAAGTDHIDLPVHGPNRYSIDPSTNLVCKRRVDFTSCDPPPSDCMVNRDGKETKLDMKECVETDGLKLKCPADADPSMAIVEHIKFTDGTVKVLERIEPFVCDKGSGKWTQKRPPYRSLSHVKDGKSYAVCAKHTCNDDDIPKSTCDSRVNCIQLEKDEMKGKFWSRVKCPQFYEMKYQADSISTRTIIVESFFCENGGWSVLTAGANGDKRETKRIKKGDNIFCQEIGVLQVLEDYQDPTNPVQQYKRKPSSKDTSDKCLPTKLDSLCPPVRYSCEPVEKRAGDTEWFCRPGKRLWYIEYYRSHVEARQINHLKCRGKFWRAIITANEEVIPYPHANFICLTDGESYQEAFAIETEKNSDLKDKNKKEETTTSFMDWWHIPLEESLVLLTSLAVMIAAAAITIYGNREWKRMQKAGKGGTLE